MDGYKSSKNKMSKKAKMVFITLFLVGLMAVFYNVYSLMDMESHVSKMKRFLQDNNYKKVEVVEISKMRSTVTFETDKGTVVVKRSRDGVYHIVY